MLLKNATGGVAGQLLRATRFDTDGTLQGVQLFEGPTAFEASVIFLDGDELTSVSGADADHTNETMTRSPACGFRVPSRRGRPVRT